MAVSRFSTSSVAQGLPKYQKLWDQTTYPFTSDYYAIQTVSVGAGGASSITFSSIPSTYKHLQIRGIYNSVANGAIRFNSDSGANYSWHQINGDGSTAGASQSYGSTYASTIYSNPGQFAPWVIDIYDYASTAKNKTIYAKGGFDNNGSGYSIIRSGVWNNQSAINTITISDSASNSIAQYSQLALYGWN